MTAKRIKKFMVIYTYSYEKNKDNKVTTTIYNKTC